MPKIMSSLDNMNTTLPAESILPYTHGLTGVNLWLNNITTQATWYTILLLAVVIVIFRRWQIWTAHSRMLLTLNLSRKEQCYWSQNESKFYARIKKHLLTAPLVRNRHHNEFQLSRAIGMGILPSRLHTFLLFTYLAANITYCFLLDFTNQSTAARYAELRGRSGHLAVINMIALFLFAARNNPLIPILRVSFDTFNLFHRWMGRVVILEAMLHTGMWAVNKFDALGWDGVFHSLKFDKFEQLGFVATIAMFLILIQTPSPIRHAFYETFLHMHQFLALATLITVFWHVKVERLPQIPLMFLIIAIWGSDRLTRIARILYRNISRRGNTEVTVEALEDGACRVSFRIPGTWTHRPGYHIYAYIPAISGWMSHPFSVAWVDHPEDQVIDSVRPSNVDNHITNRPGFSLVLSSDTSSASSSTTDLSKHMSSVSFITLVENEAVSTRTIDSSARLPRSSLLPSETSSVCSSNLSSTTNLIKDNSATITTCSPSNTTYTPSKISKSNPNPTHDTESLISIQKRTHTTVTCIMAARSGTTSKLYNRALSSKINDQKPLTLRAFIEGPYGGLENLRSYGTVVLFAGGVGITNQLGQLRDVVRASARSVGSTRKVVLIWGVKEWSGMVDVVGGFLRDVDRVGEEGGDVEIDVRVFVSGKRKNRESENKKVAAPPSCASEEVDLEKGANSTSVVVESDMDMVEKSFPGAVTYGQRMNIDRILEEIFEKRIGAMSVGVCGPGRLADEVRRGARALMGRGGGSCGGGGGGVVDFWEEGFSW